MPLSQEVSIFKLKDVLFSYNGQKVIDGVSFEITKGEKIVILGVNGSGKTTLLKLMNALIFPEKGELLYKGRRLDKSTDKNFLRNFRKEVGFLFQNPENMFFNPTVYDEIAFGPKEYKIKDTDKVVKKWAEELKISSLLEKEPYELSGGEKKKVALCSILSYEPEVLLLDEPSSGLDPTTVGWLVDFIVESDKTIITATHNLTIAEELGERFLIISSEHKIIFDGTFEEFLNQKEIILLSGLGHRHVHKHGRKKHFHFHFHDWD